MLLLAYLFLFYYNLKKFEYENWWLRLAVVSRHKIFREIFQFVKKYSKSMKKIKNNPWRYVTRSMRYFHVFTHEIIVWHTQKEQNRQDQAFKTNTVDNIARSLTSIVMKQSWNDWDNRSFEHLCWLVNLALFSSGFSTTPQLTGSTSKTKDRKDTPTPTT